MVHKLANLSCLVPQCQVMAGNCSLSLCHLAVHDGSGGGAVVRGLCLY